MWISRKEFEALKSEVTELRDRYNTLATFMETETEPFRVGHLRYSYLSADWTDLRPKVSLRRSVEMLMAHLKLDFNKINAVPERIELLKVKT